jgi:hypothetical protein
MAMVRRGTDEAGRASAQASPPSSPSLNTPAAAGIVRPPRARHPFPTVPVSDGNPFAPNETACALARGVPFVQLNVIQSVIRKQTSKGISS